MKAEELSARATALFVYGRISQWMAFSPREIRQKDVEVVKELISRAGHPFAKDYVEMTWLKIMAEEAPAYFTGQKSLQDVVDVIAGRLQTYLDETLCLKTPVILRNRMRLVFKMRVYKLLRNLKN